MGGNNLGNAHTVYHNTLDFNSEYSGSHALVVQTGGKDAIIANNIVINHVASSGNGGIAIANTYNSVKLDYNLVYNAEGSVNDCIWKINSTCYNALTAWQAASDPKISSLSWFRIARLS